MTREEAEAIVRREGEDILESPGMQLTRTFIQHGSTTVYEHCWNVACRSVMLACRLKHAVDVRALVRGALLHDYFLYDWHTPHEGHEMHGFRHAKTAWRNAKRDFALGLIEQDIIRKHMFPLNIAPPIYWESAIVCLADKMCAVEEMMAEHAAKRRGCA